LAENIRGARAPGWGGGAEPGQDRVVTTVDRQVLDHVGAERLADGAGAGLEQRGRGRDDDILGEVAGVQRELDHRVLLDADADRALLGLAEAGELDPHRVGAGTDRCDDERAVLARHGGQGEALALVGDGDGGTGQHAARLILDRAEDGARIDLGNRGCP
jgi:hypothetical protein